MPKIYRSMKKGDEGKPIVDATGKGLGVRGAPVNGVVDVDIDRSGNVILNGKGMSVAPAWRDLPYFLVSRRLKKQFPRARGSLELFCFTMGEGPFADGTIAPGLLLKTDSSTHGLVIPQNSVSLSQYQTDLADTRDRWIVDEA
jgi:hypothetical protein